MDRTDADAGAELALKGVTAPQIIKTERGREYLVLPDAGRHHGFATGQSVDGLDHRVRLDRRRFAVVVQRMT